MIKKLAAALLLPVASCVYQPALAGDWDLDISLGGVIGADDAFNSKTPFRAEIYYDQEVNQVFSVRGGCAHRSNMTQNGDEYDGEYCFGGFKAEAGLLYTILKGGRFFHGDQPDDDTFGIVEVGVQQPDDGPANVSIEHRWTQGGAQLDYDLTSVKVTYNIF